MSPLRGWPALLGARRMSRDVSRSPAVIPARHHSETVSPRSDGVMCSTTGSRPPLVCTQACRQSVAARRGVMTHQTLAMRRWRDGLYHRGGEQGQPRGRRGDQPGRAAEPPRVVGTWMGLVATRARTLAIAPAIRRPVLTQSVRAGRAGCPAAAQTAAAAGLTSQRLPTRTVGTVSVPLAWVRTSAAATLSCRILISPNGTRRRRSPRRRR
jgi:hypothetical protein